jgi:hypothetical protein
MLLDGEAKLVDLGLAKMSERSTLGTSVQGKRATVNSIPCITQLTLSVGQAPIAG